MRINGYNIHCSSLTTVPVAAVPIVSLVIRVVLVVPLDQTHHLHFHPPLHPLLPINIH